MNSSDKSAVVENEAAAGFVCMIHEGVVADWDSVWADLVLYSPSMRDEVDADAAQCEFAAMRIAAEMQALPNLLPAEQAKRVRSHVLAVIYSAQQQHPQSYDVVDAILCYDQAWVSALAGGEADPLEEEAAAFCRRLGIGAHVGGVLDGFLNPMLIMAVTGALHGTNFGWWKRFLGQYKLVP